MIAVADTFLNSLSVNTNYGTVQNLAIGPVTVGQTTIYRMLLRFNVTEIPAGSTVTSASLRIYTNGLGVVFNSVFRAKRVTRSNWTETGATNAKYDGINVWTSVGTHDSTTTDQATFTTTGSTVADLVFSLVALVQDAIDNRSGVLELLVKGDDETGSNFIEVYTREYPNSAKRPTLTVSYTAAATTAVYFQCLSAAKTIIDALALTGSPTVAIRKVPVDRNLGSGKAVALPAVILAPQQDNEERGGTVDFDDITYGVWCVIVATDNQETTLVANLPTYLLWRQQIARAFRQKRLSGVSGIINSSVRPGDVVLPEGWKSQLYVSALLLRFTSREPRG